MNLKTTIKEILGYTAVMLVLKLINSNTSWLIVFVPALLEVLAFIIFTLGRDKYESED